MLALTLALVGALPNALPQQTAAAQAADVKTHVLIVAGITGDTVKDSTFEKAFYEIGKRLADDIRTKYSVPDSLITFLFPNPARDPQLLRGPSTKVEIEKAFAAITKRVKPGDVVFVMLIGHGTSQNDKTSKFALPGPDMEAADFAKLLTPLSQQQVVFVNSTSASGDFIGTLAGKNRVVITSTSSPMERNYTRFPKHFSAAFSADGSDTDKDGRVSMLEAFEYTRRKVEQEYKSSTLLQSEHPTLEDDSDGKGVPLPGFPATDGRLAARVFLTGVMPEDPRVTELWNQYTALRVKIEGFVASRGGMDGATYGQQLEGMFVDLAVLILKIRQGAEGKP